MAKSFVVTLTPLLFLVSGLDLLAAEGESLSTPKLSAVNAKFRDLVMPNTSEASYRKIHRKQDGGSHNLSLNTC